MDLARRVLDLAEEYLLRPVQKAGQVALLGISLSMGCGDTIVNNYYGNSRQENTVPEIPDEYSPQEGFVFILDGENDLFALQDSAGNIRTFDPYISHLENGSPCTSADGRNIVFCSGTAGDYALRLLHLQTGDISLLVSDPSRECQSPRWSARDQIAFVGRDLETGVSEVFTVRPDGSQLRQLTFEGRENSTISWSPDGEWLAYISTISTSEESIDGGVEYFIRSSLMLLRYDGSEQQEVAMGIDAPTLIMSSLAWSPDGQNLAVQGSLPREEGGIYLVPREGGTAELLLPGQYQEIQWTPDGGSLVFSAQPASGGEQIYRFILASRQARNLSADPARDEFLPAVSPDEETILYTSFQYTPVRKGNLFQMHWDGTGVQQLTSYEDPQSASSAEWLGYCR